MLSEISQYGLPMGFARSMFPSSPSDVAHENTSNQQIPLNALMYSREDIHARLLAQLSHMNKAQRSLNMNGTVRPPLASQCGNTSPCDRRYQERLQARSRLHYMRERKAVMQTQYNSSHAQQQSCRQSRRISSFTESAPVAMQAQQQEYQQADDESTICMNANHLQQEQDEFDCDDIDNIFDDDSQSNFEDCFEDDSFTGEPPLLMPDPISTPNLTTLPPSRRQVSEASFRWQRNAGVMNAHVRNPTPKEAGLSSWDDVSSVATLSRIGSFEPEPLPMGDSPIPMVIYVPTSTTLNANDDSEPFSSFNGQPAAMQCLAEQLGPDSTDLFVNLFANTNY